MGVSVGVCVYIYVCAFFVHYPPKRAYVIISSKCPINSLFLLLFHQEIIPDELMEVYLSMTDHTKAQTVDSELPFYCAYSLPAVAITLGAEHWEVLRPTFHLLAGDMQVSVRTSVAWSV